MGFQLRHAANHFRHSVGDLRPIIRACQLLYAVICHDAVAVVVIAVQRQIRQRPVLQPFRLHHRTDGVGAFADGTFDRAARPIPLLGSIAFDFDAQARLAVVGDGLVNLHPAITAALHVPSDWRCKPFELDAEITVLQQILRPAQPDSHQQSKKNPHFHDFTLSISIIPLTFHFLNNTFTFDFLQFFHLKRQTTPWTGFSNTPCPSSAAVCSLRRNIVTAMLRHSKILNKNNR